MKVIVSIEGREDIILEVEEGTPDGKIGMLIKKALEERRFKLR